MFVKKTLAASGLLALMGAVAACGGSSSSTPTGAAGAPTGATTADFCSTLQNVSSSSTPKEVATKLQAVGTPSGISASQRHGFEVFVDKLGTLSPTASPSDLQQGLSATDLQDLTAFETYLQSACVPSAGSSSPSAPSS
jgi:hypothetical protein